MRRLEEGNRQRSGKTSWQECFNHLLLESGQDISILECELRILRLQKTNDVSVATISHNGENRRRAQDLKRLILDESQQHRQQQKK